MNKQIDYKIAYGETRELLVTSVKYAIEDSWQVQGNVAIAVDPLCGPRFYQTMVKISNDNTNDS